MKQGHRQGLNEASGTAARIAVAVLAYGLFVSSLLSFVAPLHAFGTHHLLDQALCSSGETVPPGPAAPEHDQDQNCCVPALPLSALLSPIATPVPDGAWASSVALRLPPSLHHDGVALSAPVSARAPPFAA